MEMKEKIQQKFAERFGGEGPMYVAPGRVNLIGEHTDYNGGFVFPGAIDKVIMAEIRPNGTERVNVVSLDMDGEDSFGLTEEERPKTHWAMYIYGICREIIKRGGNVGGFDAVFAGNVPTGAGMSSSAALESCFATAINDLFNNNEIEKFELALAGRDTENNYCGTNCGIMDQFVSLFGRKDHLIRLDCRSLGYDYYHFEPIGYKLVLVNSKVKHELKDSPYNRRRRSCERVAAMLGASLLRDATIEMLDEIRSELPPEDYFRAKYVIEERDRVLAVCAALNRQDYETVGRKMYETHRGLSQDFDVSCEELDFLVAIARKNGVTGSRMMGGGFGGCTINLIREELYEPFVNSVRNEFNQKYGHMPEIYDVVISDGARRLV